MSEKKVTLYISICGGIPDTFHADVEELKQNLYASISQVVHHQIEWIQINPSLWELTHTPWKIYKVDGKLHLIEDATP